MNSYQSMKKLIEWCKNNFFPITTLFLFVFIPLYPKLPLLDVTNTWVYVRVEDFVVLAAILVSTILLFRGKITLRTPLTTPIFLYWIIGAIATIHGILLIFPTAANVFPNVAFLSFLRRIEYMSLFFVAYWGIKEKRFLGFVSVALVGTLAVASLYGIGQKYLGFPAFLTMNEEFAKGVPIQLSALSRVPSTFAGHYDFAAFLVLVIPIVVSLMFSVNKWWINGALFAVAALGSLALLTTVSRISVVALFVAVGLVLFIQNKRLILFSLPVLVIAGYVFIRSPLVSRYVNTVKEVNVLVDASSGAPLGHIDFVPNTYFEGKVIRQQFFKSTQAIKTNTSPSTDMVVAYNQLPPAVPLMVKSITPTGEDLPQGTGYINLSLSPVTNKIDHFFYEAGPQEVQIINGSYLIKKTLAYDLSFTTRFQGEWPSALAAFKKNILVGSGYGSVSLAVDNSYLRMLGEVGIAGFAAFVSLWIFTALYVSRIWPSIDSKLTKSFTVGFGSGAIGLAINALFIDVFEASKIAFLFWLLVGVTIGTLRLYQKRYVDLSKSFKQVVTSNIAIVVYLLIITLILFGSLVKNYFVGDDFTWFRWAQHGGLNWATVSGYFTDADGFFYRPGTKLYFLLMYSVFWLNQNAYHMVSIALHFSVAVLTFFLAKKILTRTILAASAAFLFLILSGTTEAVFWISATGFLFATLFALAALLSYIRGNIALALIFSILSPLFHELGIVTPLLMLVYMLTMTEDKKINFALFVPIPLYLVVRLFANSHWFSGDYNYNLVKLPLNAAGNLIGYIFTILGGPAVFPLYQALRSGLRENLVAGALVLAGVALLVIYVGKNVLRSLDKPDRRVFWFGMLFTTVSLLPFLGLGNISSRYGYMAAVGVAILIVCIAEKIYRQLITNSKQIAFACVALGVGIISLFHIIQLVSLHDNWREAGESVRKFVVSIDRAFEDQWTTAPMELHFANVPIRKGEAWVFPVGLSDVLWFQFRNPNIKVYIEKSLADALNAVEYGSLTQRVFVFDETGQVSEVKKPWSIQ